MPVVSPSGRGFGLKLDVPRDLKLWTWPVAPLTAPPASVIDLAPGFPFDPMDQSSEGCCTACAGCGLLEWLLAAHDTPGNVVKLSEAFTYYVNRREDGSPASQDTGASSQSIAKGMTDFGACPASLMPYQAGDFARAPTNDAYAAALPYKILRYYQIQGDLLGGLWAALSGGIPTLMGFQVPASFERPEAGSGKVSAPTAADSILGGHEVVVCGWIPDHTAPGGLGWIKVRNSWGTAIGAGGYFLVPTVYWAANLVMDHMVLAFSAPPPPPPPPPPPVPTTGAKALVTDALAQVQTNLDYPDGVWVEGTLERAKADLVQALPLIPDGPPPPPPGTCNLTLGAPSVPAGGTVTAAWAGPGASGDVLALWQGATLLGNGIGINGASAGQVSLAIAPATAAGAYEVRWSAAQGSVVRATAPLAITAAPAPPVTTLQGFGVTYHYPGADHDPAKDIYLGPDAATAEWGVHWGYDALAPAPGSVKAFTFPTPLAYHEAVGADHARVNGAEQYILDHAALFADALQPGACYYALGAQTMYFALLTFDTPQRLSNGQLVKCIWLGHVKGDIPVGRVAVGQRWATIGDSGIRFESDGIQARASHAHTAGSVSGALTMNGEVNGFLVAALLGWHVVDRGVGPGPNEYLTGLWIAGKTRAAWGTHPVPPMPNW